MSAGPATKMYEACLTAHEASTEREMIGAGDLCDRATRDLTPATLEAMDVAAEVMESHHTLEEEWPMAFDQHDHALVLRGSHGQTLSLHPAHERQLFRKLVQRAIQRRKEAGHGA